MANDEHVPQFRTTGRIAQELRVPLHRVLYVLRSRPHIKPSARAGRIRLYSSEAVQMIQEGLDAADVRNAGVAG